MNDGLGDSGSGVDGWTVLRGLVSTRCASFTHVQVALVDPDLVLYSSRSRSFGLECRSRTRTKDSMRHGDRGAEKEQAPQAQVGVVAGMRRGT